MYKLSKADIVSFLMNFLAVVLGIVLTLGGESLMSHKLERKFYEHKLKYLEPAMNKNVKDILAGDNVTAIRLWSEMTNSNEGRQYLREIIRFLSNYDPSEIYEATELTIDGIKEYCR